MARKKVYVTRRFPGNGLAMLREKCDVRVNKQNVPPSRSELLRNARGVDAIVCMLSDRIDDRVMDKAGPQLKVISSYSTGYEHIDIKEATSRGIYVTYTADTLAEATADLAFALILACARKIVQGDRLVRDHKWKVGWKPDLLLGSDVHNATLGIIGLGRIGSAVARRAKGFGMTVVYNTRRRDPAKELQLGVKYVDLDDLLSLSDFVSVHASLNSSSRHIINATALRKMKPTAYLINTSRGQVINERDLARALSKRWLAGAGLDVFEKEPLPKSSALARARNVVLLPHIGSATTETRSRMGEVAARNVLDVIGGRSPKSTFLVNPEASSHPS